MVLILVTLIMVYVIVEYLLMPVIIKLLLECTR